MWKNCLVHWGFNEREFWPTVTRKIYIVGQYLNIIVLKRFNFNLVYKDKVLLIEGTKTQLKDLSFKAGHMSLNCLLVLLLVIINSVTRLIFRVS